MIGLLILAITLFLISQYFLKLESSGNPEINVIKGFDSILPADECFLGNTTIGKSKSTAFFIQNNGESDLIIENISLTHGNIDQFSLKSPAIPYKIERNGYMMFIITFMPSSLGIKNATVTITNNDLDESEYTFHITASSLEINIPHIELGNGTTYYIDPDGNDGNSGLSEKNPWKTIDKINSEKFQPGDNILFKRGGVWKGKMEIHSSGSESSPILIGAYGTGEKPVIVAPVDDAAIVLVAADYLVLQNLDLRGGYNTLAVYGSDHTIIEDCNVGKGAFLGIWVNQKEWEPKRNHSNYGIIRRCIIDQGYNTERHSEDGIHFRDGVNYWQIYDNEIRDWGHSGISFLQEDDNTTVSHNKVYRNLITGENSDYMRGFDIKGNEGGNQYNEFYFNIIRDTSVRNQIAGDHNLIYYNIFDNVKNSKYENVTTEAGAININGGWTKTQVGHDNKILNNVIYSCDEAGIEIRSHEISPAIYNIEIKNNIIVDCGKNSIIGLNDIAFWVKNESKIKNITVENNIIYNPDLTYIVNYKGITMSVGDFNNLDRDGNIIRNNIQIDPKFVDPENHDFHLQYNSPAIDAGIYVDMSRDFEGAPVPWHGGVDIGAFEYH